MVLKLRCGKSAGNLSSEDRLVLNRLIEEYSGKVRRHLGEEPEVFEVRLKCHSKTGNAKRYNIKVKFSHKKFNFETNSDEWSLKDAFHKAMEKLLNEIEHKFERKRKDKSWKRKFKNFLFFKR